MRRRPEPTRRNARRRTWASQASRRHPGPEILMTVVLYRPKRQERLIVQPIGEETREVQSTTLLEPAQLSIPATFRPWHGALQIRATQSWTRSTSSSRTSKSRSSSRNETNSSRSRTRSTRSWINKRRVTRRRSKWNRSISNRRSNCSKNTNSRRNSWSRDNSQRTGSRPGGKIALPQESLIVPGTCLQGQVFIERALNENRAGYRPTSRCLACRPSCLEISPRLEGNLEPPLRVHSRYWSTDIGRPQIAEAFVCIFRYRTLPLKTGSIRTP